MSYGDWAQWNRRWDKVKAGDTLMGVNCPHTDSVLALCADCEALYLAWLDLHGLEGAGNNIESEVKAARMVAGL